MPCVRSGSRASCRCISGCVLPLDHVSRPHPPSTGGKGGGKATQTGTLSQGSSASAPASQYAPASNVSVLSFGGSQEIDNHPSNSASATSGNSGGVHQKQG